MDGLLRTVADRARFLQQWQGRRADDPTPGRVAVHAVRLAIRSPFAVQGPAVIHAFDARTLEDDRRRQVLLAALAETAEVRRVHEALEQLYRTQLVAMELADRLGRHDGG